MPSLPNSGFLTYTLEISSRGLDPLPHTRFAHYEIPPKSINASIPMTTTTPAIAPTESLFEDEDMGILGSGADPLVIVGFCEKSESFHQICRGYA